ncbi:MAG: VanW family protein [Lachnospiraceae bacterium]|nr:VanW family protein [Lachnospiraceae bacterium]
MSNGDFEGRSSSYKQQSSSRKQSGSRKKKRKNNQFSPVKVMIAVLILLSAIALIILGVKLIKKAVDKPAAEEVETEVPEETLEKDVTVDGVSISSLGRTQARVAIEKKYNWSMKAKLASGEPDSYDISSLIVSSIDRTLDMIYSGADPEESYTISFEIDDSLLDTEIENMKALWNKDAKNGSISGFDKETGHFTYSESEPGISIDEEKLRNDIRTAFAAKKFSEQISVNAETIQPDFDEEKAREMYKTIGTYTTKSTNNADRNNNLNLACNAIDGLVLQVGEEFSFNHTTGKRSADRGYKEAAAYQNGEVVNEPGGGVCQVASTLYNAVIFSGLEVTERHPHTYAPTYVTPGEDATVSFDGYQGPDLRFTNTTSSAIVIRAHYADRTVTCSVIGIPILEEGEKISLHSEKVGETDVPAPAVEDDPSLEPGIQVQVSSGDKGSTWNTYLKHEYPDGRVTDELFHVSKYRGHTPKVRRNQATWDPAYELLTPQTGKNEAGETILIYSNAETATEEEPDIIEVGPGQTETRESEAQYPAPSGDQSPQEGPGGGTDEGSSPVPGDIPLVPVVPVP